MAVGRSFQTEKERKGRIRVRSGRFLPGAVVAALAQWGEEPELEPTIGDLLTTVALREVHWGQRVSVGLGAGQPGERR